MEVSNTVPGPATESGSPAARSQFKGTEPEIRRPSITGKQFSVTNLPQKEFKPARQSEPIGEVGHIVVDPKEGAQLVMDTPSTSPATVSQLSPKKGYVFLLVSLRIASTRGYTVIGGTDYYLTDGRGDIDSGYVKQGTDEWVSASGFSKNLDAESSAQFLYNVKKEWVAGSVFHFVTSDLKVPDSIAAKARKLN